MNSLSARVMVVGSWVAAIAVLVSASLSSALGVAALWSIPAAVVVTVIATVWPGQRLSTAACLIGLAWQAALLVSYWPVTSITGGAIADWIGQLPMPLHALVITAVLCVLALAFIALFMIPALALLNRLRRVAIALRGGQDPESAASRIIGSDPTLDRAWREYSGHQYLTASGQRVSSASSRHFFNLSACAESRLRIEFFRNLPGMFTGIGIIGTFSGLILGLRAFRVSDETSVVQSSLNSLLHGVWESCLISAVAISLAIVVTLAEKVLMAALVRGFDTVAQILDEIYPPQPAAQAVELSTNGSLQHLEALFQRLVASNPTAVAPSSASSERPALPAEPAAFPMEKQVNSGQDRMVDSLRMLTERLDIYFSDHVKASALAQQQSNQALKSLAGRLEMVASSIESSGRKTMEVVGTRLMDAHLNMSARQQAMSEQMADLVGRIEVLCSLMQRDPMSLQAGAIGFELNGRQDDGVPIAATGASTRPRNANIETVGSDWYGATNSRGASSGSSQVSTQPDFSSGFQFNPDFPADTRSSGNRFGS
ncbi:MAG: hypothetical protein ACK56N_09230 [Betaproteobacteria bacterium]